MSDAIHERLADARRRAGLSIGQAAQRSGLPRSVVEEAEANQGATNDETLNILAKLYDVSDEWLRGEYTPRLEDVLPGVDMGKVKLSPDDLGELVELLGSMRLLPPLSDPNATATVEQALRGHLRGKGLWPESAVDAVVQATKNDLDMVEMLGRWDTPAEDYPAGMLATILYSGDLAALAWIDTNMPQAFFRYNFTGNQE